jgi:two-component system response regulator YesN
MPYTILLVDDDKDFRSEFREMLQEEYEIIEASGGEQALDIINKPNIVDLVILDVRMQGIQGTEVLKRLKQIDPYLKIIMLTAYGKREVIIDSLRGHADDFLEKPLKIGEALATIKKILGKKQDEVLGLINKIKYAVEKNFHKNISLKEAAEIVCLSPKYISRIFKEHTGVGFHEYKLKLKIEKAKEMIREADFNINEIAYKIGYLNTESFIRIFKKTTGLTPTKFRSKKIPPQK